MRTDGVQVAAEAIAAARAVIAEDFGGGEHVLPKTPRHYATKAKNAQEAHEAIRPTDLARRPAGSGDEAKLYALIWKRTIASQMASAKLERTAVDLTSDKATLRASGQVVLHPGFLAVYTEDRDDVADGEDPDDTRRLPKLVQGEKPKVTAARADQHFTEPPPRYSEASLVKRLEELGIGRPSTYASILQTLRDRAYVRMEKNRFFAEEKGRLVTAFLERYFEKYVSYDFTADLETRLDEVSAGDLDYLSVLKRLLGGLSTADEGGARYPPVRRDGRPRRVPRALPVPAQGRRQRPAPVPDLRHRPARPQDRQVRRVRRPARTIPTAATPVSSARAAS